jgi:RHS repeat-associated protein
VDAREGASVWGKGESFGSDQNIYAINDLQTGGTCPATGMAASSVHLMLANLQIRDTPVGYTPPVGPPVRFTLRYNHRDYIQPASSTSKLLGPKWTHDWIESLQISSGTAKYIVGGGGARVFTGFNATTQTYAPNQYDQTLLHRLSANTYEMIWPDGSKKLFGPASRALGLLLTQVVDPAGNAVTLTYDQNARLVAISDAIGQVTTISYEHPANIDLITKVTDPFGRFATFDYALLPVVSGPINPDCTNFPSFFRTYFLAKITDVLGLQSAFDYAQEGNSCERDTNGVLHNVQLFTDTIANMATPYGKTFFTTLDSTNSDGRPYRVVQSQYPDGSSEKVLYSQSTNTGISLSEPSATVPVGMTVLNGNLQYRNTYYWSRTAQASSSSTPTKARIYHWLHNPSGGPASGILESTKEPLENRVWYNYAGQSQGAQIVGDNNRPIKIGRVLDDGQTQLHTQAYDQFGHVTNSVDPLGRTFSFIYATNGIDLLEVRQTRAVNNELLFRATYNAQHRPLTVVDAAGQTNTYTYNARGQPLTATNPKGETTTYTYDADGHLFAVDGPLPGTNDTVTAQFDVFSRIRTLTSVSGYRLAFDYDEMDRITRITHPDSTFEQFTYDRLDMVTFRDRAGRQTFFEYDNLRQVKKRTDPLGRVTRFDWCRCGQIRSLTDPMGRTTTWLTDVQGRPTAKQYADGSRVTYQYENTSSRLHLAIDEKQQVTQFLWNRDDTLKSLAYGSAIIPTPGVSFTYDPDYERVVSMTDGTGTTRYSYHPITGIPTLGAGALASVDGPLPNDTITYGYDELGRPVHRAINGVDSAMTFDEAGRLIGVTNVLGAFAYAYDGSSGRLISKSFPNGQTTDHSYGNTLQDLTLQRITHTVGVTPLSEFLYGRDVPKGRITTWSQQASAQSPNLLTFGYDSVNQLLSATVTNAGNLVNIFTYTYDPAGNRLTEQVGASNYTATYNGLNEIRTTTAPGATRTNEWDAEDRLVAVNVGNQRTEFTYDGLSRRAGIRQLVSGSEVSHRRFVWCGGEICEERDASGVVIKRYFPQGMKVESGPAAGAFFYTRDHLGSIRELMDASGNVRARYAYDPYGRRIRLTGDVETDFGFAGMFWSAEADLFLTHFRAYDAELGRWLSRDPLPASEMLQGPNLYAYVVNDPVNYVDPSGLAGFLNTCTANPVTCSIAMGSATQAAQAIQRYGPALQRWSPFIQRGNMAMQCAQNAGGGELAFTVLEVEHVPLVVEALGPAVPNLQRSINSWITAAQAIRYNPHPQTGVPVWQMLANWMSSSRNVPWDKVFSAFAGKFQTISQALADKLGIPLSEAEKMLARMAWGVNPVE